MQISVLLSAWRPNAQVLIRAAELGHRPPESNGVEEAVTRCLLLIAIITVITLVAG